MTCNCWGRHSSCETGSLHLFARFEWKADRKTYGNLVRDSHVLLPSADLTMFYEADSTATGSLAVMVELELVLELVLGRAVLTSVGPGLRMSMPPLKKAPSSMEMRAAMTSPVREPSLRISTRSDAWQLPRTLPRTTISRAEMLAATWPLRPTVTRLPGRVMAPSIRPSM